MATHMVVRPFPGPGGKSLPPGTEVDASTWRHAAHLVRRRYLRPLERPAELIPEPRKIATPHPNVAASSRKR